jgi:SAM-dependent methyltransferase
MQIENLAFLRSSRGEALLTELEQEQLKSANTLALLTRLRKRYSANEAAAALELATLRQKAVEKFGTAASQMWFTRDALEQASHPAVRTYRAHNFKSTDTEWFDMCCGIGSDALAFADAALTVTGIDLDPLRVELARLNNDALGLNARFEVGDVTLLEPPSGNIIFFDPARRANDRRIFDVEAYIPPLSTVHRWSQHPVYVKLSPGIDLIQLAPYGGNVEFISVEGDLKEALLHLEAGQPRTEVTLSATLLTEDEQVHRWKPPDTEPEVVLSEPREWLIEPDPALLRANLVHDAAVQFSAAQLDETIAYLTADEAPQSSWIRSWRVLDWMPFNIKKLRAALRERDVGRVTVKKRGSPLTPEQLMAQLKLKGGSQTRTLVLTRLRGQPIVIICEEHPVSAIPD